MWWRRDLISPSGSFSTGEATGRSTSPIDQALREVPHQVASPVEREASCKNDKAYSPQQLWRGKSLFQLGNSIVAF